jgi:hypothetical protein
LSSLASSRLRFACDLKLDMAFSAMGESLARRETRQVD